MAVILDGKLVRSAVIKELKAKVAELSPVLGAPGLAVIQLGENPASTAYVNNKEKYAGKAGIRAEVHRLPEATPEIELHTLIAQLNGRADVHGMIVQMPLPAHIDTDSALAAVATHKDVDGLTPISQGLLWSGRAGLRSCTPAGVMRILDHYGVSPFGRRVVIVGRSNLVGKPLAAMMLERHATVTICHSRTPDLADVCRSADILVAAAGRAGLITKAHVKPGAVVVDVATNYVETGELDEYGAPITKLTGDVLFDEVEPVASMITPVPGGVGPMTIAMLLSNVVAAWSVKSAAQSA